MQTVLINPHMETNNNNQGGLEDIVLKIQGKDTTEDELVGILADILAEAFIWQEEHKGEEQAPYLAQKKG